jgi:hypothetical protein
MLKYTFIFFFFLPLFTLAQGDIVKTTKPAIKGTLVHTVLYHGDTIPYMLLSPVVCSASRPFKNNRQRLAWDRLKYNVKKVYPYAIIAAARLKEYDRVLAKMPNENDRRTFTKMAENQLKKEFEDDLKNMSMSQGRILIKLIDRETGKTSYEIVKNMRGSFSAAMWQGVALMFNSSLKSDYDAEGDEKGIELVIKMIEDGTI